MAELEPQFSKEEVLLGEVHKDIRAWFNLAKKPASSAEIHLLQHDRLSKIPSKDGEDKIIRFRPSSELFRSTPVWEPSHDDGEEYPLAANEG